MYRFGCRLAVSSDSMLISAAHLAYHDHLTGLSNRTAFHEALTRALARSRRHSRLNAVLFRSLHHFAQIPYSLESMFDSVLAQSALSAKLRMIVVPSAIAPIIANL